MKTKKTIWIFTFSVIGALLFMISSCKKDDDVNVPTLTTTAVTEITSSNAISGGMITDNGGAAVTVRGVCWSTSPNPTTAGNKTEDGAGSGSFTSNITGLEANTKYYVRAYATNSAGTAYGNQLEFTTALGINLPVLTTKPVTEIDRHTAVSGGDITSDGGGTISARGICWSTSPNPTIEDDKTEDGDGTGSFVSNVTGLESNTTYYLRAYATNEAGTGYGNEIEFTTLQEGLVIDIDGNVYPTVIIGDQEWMAVNLRVKNFNNGNPIAGPFAGDDWVAQSTNAKVPAYTIYNHAHSSAPGLESPQEVVEAYGKMYNWHAVETGNLCPHGWRVPDTTDWNQLIDHIIATNPDFDENNVAAAVKGCRQINHPLGGDCSVDENDHPRWREDSEHFGVDTYGLGLYSVGYILSTSGNSSWLGARGYWWTSSPHTENPDLAIFRRFNHTDSQVTKGSFNRGVGQPIRCIKN